MLKLLTLLTLVEVFDIVNCFIIPHRVAALHYPRWIDTKLDMSGRTKLLLKFRRLHIM